MLCADSEMWVSWGWGKMSWKKLVFESADYPVVYLYLKRSIYELLCTSLYINVKKTVSSAIPTLYYEVILYLNFLIRVCNIVILVRCITVRHGISIYLSLKFYCNKTLLKLCYVMSNT